MPQQAGVLGLVEPPTQQSTNQPLTDSWKQVYQKKTTYYLQFLHTLPTPPPQKKNTTNDVISIISLQQFSTHNLTTFDHTPPPPPVIARWRWARTPSRCGRRWVRPLGCFVPPRWRPYKPRVPPWMELAAGNSSETTPGFQVQAASFRRFQVLPNSSGTLSTKERQRDLYKVKEGGRKKLWQKIDFWDTGLFDFFSIDSHLYTV